MIQILEVVHGELDKNKSNNEKRNKVLEKMKTAYILIFEDHQEMHKKVDNMDKKIQIYEREISDYTDQIKTKDQIIDDFQSIMNQD